ncbi:hypothetical protein SDC9_184678 [bioreactor metagenome]|uniref:Uncharacterized protein n=1 Tax=bioreactor metagenome TaxID=1076179 RepID=A0A645HFK1_9ZZZZ
MLLPVLPAMPINLFTANTPSGTVKVTDVIPVVVIVPMPVLNAEIVNVPVIAVILNDNVIVFPTRESKFSIN